MPAAVFGSCDDIVPEARTAEGEFDRNAVVAAAIRATAANAEIISRFMLILHSVRYAE
jgi:hypothetical protein